MPLRDKANEFGFLSSETSSPIRVYTVCIKPARYSVLRCNSLYLIVLGDSNPLLPRFMCLEEYFYGGMCGLHVNVYIPFI